MHIYTHLGTRKGKCDPNLTTKFSRSEIFDFPKLVPEWSWGIAGMGGHAETCSKHTATRQRASHTLPQLHDVVATEYGNAKEFQTLEIMVFQNLKIQ